MRVAKARSAMASARVARPDDRHGAGALAGAQELAPGHEGAEDHVGEVGLASHEAAELGRRDAEHPPGLATRAVR